MVGIELKNARYVIFKKEKQSKEKRLKERKLQNYGR